MGFPSLKHVACQYVICDRNLEFISENIWQAINDRCQVSDQKCCNGISMPVEVIPQIIVAVLDDQLQEKMCLCFCQLLLFFCVFLVIIVCNDIGQWYPYE